VPIGKIIATRKRKTKTGAPVAATRAEGRGAAPMHELLPLHHRIYIVLRRRLLEGVFHANEPLPGEHQLAAEFKVSRETVRRVLDRLAQEGLIDRRHGVGTFPASGGDDTPVSERKISYYDFIALSSQRYDDKFLEFAVVPTPAEVRREDPAFGPTTLKVSRLRRHEGLPQHIVDSYVPAALASFITPARLGSKTVLEVLKKAGVEADTSEMWISAVAADSLEALQLNVEIGAPLVHATRVSRDAHGRAIEFSRFHSVAESFGYRFSFDRGSIWARIPGGSDNPK
jgi:GntR family transcriptional regulator